jgi:hypothetical protein
VDKYRHGELEQELNVPEFKQSINKISKKRNLLELHDCPVKPFGQIQ